MIGIDKRFFRQSLVALAQLLVIFIIVTMFVCFAGWITTVGGAELPKPRFLPVPQFVDVPVTAEVKDTTVQLVAVCAKWCGPCREAKPILQRLRKHWTVTEVDIDSAEGKAYQSWVEGVPTFAVYVGDECRATLTGAQTQEALDKLIRDAVDKPVKEKPHGYWSAPSCGMLGCQSCPRTWIEGDKPAEDPNADGGCPSCGGRGLFRRGR